MLDRVLSELLLNKRYRKESIGTEDLKWLIADIKELSEASGRVADGDYGAVVVSNNGLVWSIGSGVETDPVFLASAAAGITGSDITNWNSIASEFSADEIAAIHGANAPTALNPFATMADVPGAHTIGANLWPYKTKTSITSGDPGSGYVIWNNATQISATQLNFSHLTTDGTDIDILLSYVGVGDTLILQDEDNSTNYQIWEVSGTTTIHTNSYIEIPVTLSSSGGTGTTGFANNHRLIAIRKSSDYTETDPVFSASAAAGITGADITNWDTAYGWGNHAGLYLSSSASSTQDGYFDDIYLYDDASPSHYLRVTNEDNLTAARTLGLNVNDGDRTLTLMANLTVAATASVSGTNTGDQSSIVGISGTKAQFDTACSDGNFLYVGDVTSYTDEMAQDAVGAMVANSTFITLTYVDGTPSLTASLSATGTPSATTYLRGDNTWTTLAGGGDLLSTNNLSDVANASTALANLGITGTDIANWNMAYGWGDHSLGGYLTVETDPVFGASAAAGIAAGDITNWNTAYGWGNHAGLYLSSSNTSTQSGYFGDIFLKDDTSPSHYLAITNAENLTANHTLSIVTGDADRTLTFTGDASISGTHSGTSSGTNTGDQTSIVGITGTKAQFDTACSDGNFLYVGDVTQYTDEMAQDAIGAMIDTTLEYVDATPLLRRAALTGAITASAGSNATLLGSFTKSQLDTAVSDGNVLYVGDITQYTDEMAQDAVGAMVANSTFVSLTYVDGTPSLTAALSATGTPGATKFLRGDNTWAVPTAVLSDGDYGDVLVSGSGTAMTVEAASGIFSLSGVTTDTTSSGGLDDYALSATVSCLRFNAAATIVLRGLQGGAEGRILVVENIHGVGTVSLTNEAGTSTAANRILCGSTTTMYQYGCVILRYDGGSSRWKVIGGWHNINTSASDINGWPGLLTIRATAVTYDKLDLVARSAPQTISTTGKAIPSLYAMYVPDKLEISNNATFEISNGATLEIG